MAKIIIVVAYDQNFGIGKKGDLLYRFDSDLKHFKELTTGHTVVMGKNTWNSLPKKLPNRRNIVISSTEQTGADLTISLNEDGLNYILSLDETVYVIGGSNIYKAFLPYADILEITFIDSVKDADTYVDFFEEALSNFSILKRKQIQDLDKISRNVVRLEFLSYIRK